MVLTISNRTRIKIRRALVLEPVDNGQSVAALIQNMARSLQESGYFPTSAAVEATRIIDSFRDTKRKEG